ncbi:HAD-IB family phosphatase [Rariglobus hedericola]|uniref:phosphoserine phosphatase n=1 Tax=Rariglobus hedericola TaxID=2597822 RepID=A0A556QP39_9BACT|nr:HAD-IB family phosphatase [Rariglobus hedericola]TSJ78387.1 HAD-IB family phosphatase [Rariglobus hedericola]
MSGPKLLIFDCDSTLSSIEGIDELARVRGPEVFKRVEEMTNEAMDGKISVEAVFGRRLEIIQPEAKHVAQIGQHYIDTVEPDAKAVIAQARAADWTVMIISGGFRPIIRPLADFLGIERVEAVDLFFDEAGRYTGFDESYPTTRSGGKPEVITRLKSELKPDKVVMVGDGASDLETKPVVDLFVGFGRYMAREKVKRESAAFITQLSELPALIARI